MRQQFNGKELVVSSDSFRLVPNGPQTAAAQFQASAQEIPRVPLSHYLWVFKRHGGKMALFVLSFVCATGVISSRITPVYESTATVDIDRQSPSSVIGQESSRTMIFADSDQFLATQIKHVQSDSVLRPVAQKFGLLHDATENGKRWDSTNVTRSPAFQNKLQVSRPSNTYLLQISYRSPDPALASDVANDIAQSYLNHAYQIRFKASQSLATFMEKQLEELRAKMERSGAALAQFEKELNVINPEERTNILSSRLLQLNTEYTNAQADRVRKEAGFQSVSNGSQEAAQVSGQGEPLRRVMERLGDAQEKFHQASSYYGSAHPEYKKAAAQLAEMQSLRDRTRQSIIQRVEIEYNEALNREAMLKRTVQETKSEFDRLNARSFEYQSLKRDAEGDKKLYEELFRRIKEAGINAGFQNSSIRIADLAQPALQPVFPNVKLNIGIALLLSTMLALSAALLSDALDNTIRDPEQVTRSLNAQVLGSLPMVKNWKKQLGPASVSNRTALIAQTEPAGAVNTYSEAIRTLRNSILLGEFDRNLKSILITSASPGEGKSTIAAHLASTHAAQHQRTLLIDGDLRRPSVHKRFGVAATVGLSNVLLGEASWRSVVTTVEGFPDLSIMAAGPPSREAADLIGRGLVEVLEEATRDYDMVILDAPPLLGFAEPLQMAAVVDGVIVITRAGETSRKAVGAVLATLSRLRANVLGVVLNQVRQEMSDSYYYYGNYGKYYRTVNGS